MVDYSLAASAIPAAAQGQGLAATLGGAAPVAAAKGMDPARKAMAAQMLMGGLQNAGGAMYQPINVQTPQFRDR